nr:tetratricopeptide repeat protein [uncultured Blautia sp.]
MDKNEYRAKLEEINDLVDNQDYQGALKIVDTIDWRRVRSARTLCMIGEIYEANKRYEDSRKLLLLAHQRAPIGKTVLYRLVELSIKMGNYNEAADYYKSFVEISPNDNSRYILKYKLYRARRSPIEEQIQILQEYKEKEYTERWSYELARLYAKAGMKEECIETCDDLILWFSEGKYVTKAMELKMKFTSLTPQQQEKYENGSSKKITETAAKAAAAVAAASEAAANVVEKITPEEQEEIEKILNSVELKIPEPEPAPEKPEHLQDKVAQDLRDVLQGSTADEAEEIAVAMDPAMKASPEEKGYVVKNLEPEDLSKTTGFKPFHIGEGMTMQVKAEAPKSKMFDSKDFVPGSLQTSSKEFELDLEALLAETANELAQAVAEETGNQEEITEESAEEVVKESVEEVIEEAVEEPVEEIVEEAKEEPEESRAPEIAAAAVSLSAALAAKADEFDALAAGMTQEVVIKRDLEEPEVTEVQEEPVEVIPESEEEILEQEETPEEIIEEAIETMEALSDAGESSAEIVEELAEELKTAGLEEPETIETVETEVEEGATKEFPVEKVKEALGEIDLSKALEEELEDTISPKQDDSHIKRVTGSVAVNQERKSAAFGTAVEGLMRHHLTEEEHRRLFTYFFPIPGMSQQINEALDTAQESACSKTSQEGNIIVTGREGSGKTRLSEGLIKALCKERQMEGAKVAYITAEKLNKKDPVAVVGKLAGGFLVVENAGALKADVVENMSKAMEFKTNRLTVILEDLKPGIRSLQEKYPDFMKKFDSTIVIPVFTNDELVSFAKTYAKELGYKIDNMAVLALYTLIGENQNEENPVAVGTVREMMDNAIARASKKGRRVGKKVSKRHLDETGRIMLYEKDFDI